MASAQHWANAVYLSPKRIQVNSIVSVPENDIESASLDSHATDDVIEQVPSASQESEINPSQEIIKTTIEVTEEKATFFNPICCASFKTSDVLNENRKPTSGNIFIVSENVERVKEEQQGERQQGLELVSVVGEENAVAEESDEDEKIPKHIHYMLERMYNLGLSTYNPSHDPKEPVSWTKYILQILQRIIFWTISILAFQHSIYLIKINWFIFAGFGGIKNLVDVGFCIIPILADVYVAHMFAFRHEKLTELLESLKEIRSKDGNGALSNSTTKKEKRAYRIIKAMIVVSILVCMLQTGAPFVTEESMEQALLKKSERMGYLIFIWTTDDYVNKNLTEKLTEDYGTHLNIKSIFMGGTRCLLEFCNSYKLEILIDLIIITGWCFKSHLAKHAKYLQSIDFQNYTNGNDNEALTSATGDWAKYKKLKKANKAINGVFDILLKFMHIHTMTSCAYFMMHILDNEFSNSKFLLLLYDIVKLSVAYYIAKQSHSYNPIFQQWVIDWAMHSNDTQFLLRVPAMLEEMKKDPLGLGTGEFIIGETFIIKLFGYATSLVMLQVDKSDG